MSNLWEPDFSKDAERIYASRRSPENGPRMLTMAVIVAVCVAAGIYAIAKFFS